jgi:hypothetical protein
MMKWQKIVVGSRELRKTTDGFFSSLFITLREYLCLLFPWLKPGRSFAFYLLPFALCLLPFILGCGREGLPKVPTPVVPTPVADLTGIPKDGNVQLEWTVPIVDTTGRELKALKTFEVYRREVPFFPPWEFSQDSERWTPDDSLAPFKVHKGALLTVLLKGNRAFLTSEVRTNLIDPATIKYIKIRLRIWADKLRGEAYQDSSKESQSVTPIEGYFLFIKDGDLAWDTDLSSIYEPVLTTSYTTYSSNLGLAKRKKFLIEADSAFHEYVLDMSTVPGWVGNITQVGLLLVYPGLHGSEDAETQGHRDGTERGERKVVSMFPEGKQEIEIDYIRPSAEKDSLATKYEQYPWFFTEDEEGWTIQSIEGLWDSEMVGSRDDVVTTLPRHPTTSLPIFGVAKGVLYAESQKGPLFLTSRAGIGLDTTKFNQLEIRLKVSGRKAEGSDTRIYENQGYLLFQTAVVPKWDLDVQSQYIPTVYTSYNPHFSTLNAPKRVPFSIRQQDTYMTYRFNMIAFPGWTGIIKRIGLLFPDVQKVFVDSIQVRYVQPPSTDKKSMGMEEREDTETGGHGDSTNREKEETSISSLSPASTSQKVIPRVESSFTSGTSQDPQDEEVREQVLARLPVSEDIYVPYETLPTSKERSFKPFKLASLQLDNPELTSVEKGRMTFTDSGQLINVDMEQIIKDLQIDLQNILPPEVPLKPWAKYEYYVLGSSGKRRHSEKSNVVTVEVSKDPAPPSHFTAKPDDGKIILQWQPVFLTEDGLKLRSFAGYNVYRSITKEKFPDKPVNATILTDTQLTDTGLINGQTYYYVVRAVRSTGVRLHESANSEEIAVAPIDLIPPAIPAGLKGTFLEDSVRLYWNPNLEKDFAGYRVYRSEQKTGKYIPLNDEPFPQASYRDFKIEKNKVYYYKIVAVDNNSPPNVSRESTIVEIGTTSEE